MSQELEDRVEQLTVQLAGCSVAALGGTKDPAKPGDYGWSPAYQDVLNLRLRVEAALKELGVPQSGYPAPVANAVKILMGESLGDERIVGPHEPPMVYDPNQGKMVKLGHRA